MTPAERGVTAPRLDDPLGARGLHPRALEAVEIAIDESLNSADEGGERLPVRGSGQDVVVPPPSAGSASSMQARSDGAPPLRP